MPPEVLLQALRTVWLALGTLALPRAVMGGIALSAWQHVRATHDIDLLLGATAADAGVIAAALLKAGVRPMDGDNARKLGKLRLMRFVYEPPELPIDLHVDILIGADGYERRALERRITVSLPSLDIEIAVLACEDLLLHKWLAGRVIDVADTVALLRANRATLDWDYLRQWAGELRLDRDMAEAWAAAFPGEPPPAALVHSDEPPN